jgi:hypothetical protein
VALAGAVWAAQETSGGKSEGGGGAPAYVVPYSIVILCVGLSLLVVCRSSRRREKAKGEKYEVSLSSQITKKHAIPVITPGMRIDQVNKLLGKPTVCRRGDDIYRGLAQAGKLSEEDAAKEHSIYEHPAGRYELVSLDKRVIEVKTQPKPPESED